MFYVLPNFLLPYFPNSPLWESFCENETVYLKYLILKKTYCNGEVIKVCISQTKQIFKAKSTITKITDVI